MEKMKVQSVADLVRAAQKLELGPSLPAAMITPRVDFVRLARRGQWDQSPMREPARPAYGYW